jgi:hypothetical protein
MDAGDVDTCSADNIVKRQTHWPPHKPINGQGPSVGVNPRHSKMAEHDCILDTRNAIEELMWAQRMAGERTRRIKRHTGHGTIPVQCFGTYISAWIFRPTCRPGRSSERKPMTTAGSPAFAINNQ